MSFDSQKNAAFHNELAPHYDERLAGNPHNALARAAFWELVARYVPAGNTVLDFGCGTGLDAQEYLRRGYRVLAYDNSPGMVRELERRCPKEIAAGRLTAWSADYTAFLERFPQTDAVTANFAVLNSIKDLDALFETFARHLTAPGWVVVSILNPFHWSKVRMPQWWLAVSRNSREPRAFVDRPYAAYLHFVPAVLRAAYRFQLVARANVGAFVRFDMNGKSLYLGADAHARPIQKALWRTPAYYLLGHFVFLVFRRDA